MKTKKEIFLETTGVSKSFFKNVINEEEFNIEMDKKLYSEEEIRLKLSDMYRLACNEYGKANVWSMTADELLDNVDLLIEKILFGEKE